MEGAGKGFSLPSDFFILSKKIWLDTAHFGAFSQHFVCLPIWHGDGVGNTVEKNSSILSLI